MSHLCASIIVHTAEQAIADAARAAETGADMVEFRIDSVADDPIVREIVTRSIVPCIVTCRPESDGGESKLDDAQRLSLLTAATAAGAKYCDIELNTYKRNQQSIVDGFESLVVSHHDFTGRPRLLYNIIDSLNELGADVMKLAWTARSIRDNIEAFELLRERQGPLICLCMGETGLLSRVLTRKFGGFLTFASVQRETVTAPGQPTIEDLKRIYRWDAISATTKVFGVVGSPVAHSMSPALHNAAFDAIGFNGVFLPMLVEPSYESFKAFMESFVAFEPLDLAGLSITIPHKENALRYLRSKGAQIDDLSNRIGAVNTIKIDRDGRGTTLLAFNTDHDAVLDTITTALSIDREHLRNYRVAVIGAGGAARAAVAALAHHGATVVVYNRTRKRADALAQEFDGKPGRVVAARLEKLCDSCCHVFINMTPLGMHPDIDASPLGERLPEFTGETLAFDAVYNPADTKFLQQARAAGAKTVGGGEMFIHQAASQFRIFTGLQPPIEVMKTAFQQRLLAMTSA